MVQPQDPKAHLVGNASALLTAASLDRWRDIVRRASSQGADIAQLVQHFAERAFENKSVSLEQQGSKRRALANLRQVVIREHQRAKAALGTQLKDGRLRRAYNAVRIDFTPPTTTLAQQANKKVARLGEAPLSSISDEHTWNVVPVTPPITYAKDLVVYMDNLMQQTKGIDDDLVKIDEVLNRGVANHARTVADLSAASKELYRIAQEVISSMPKKPAAGLGLDEQTEPATKTVALDAAKANTMSEEPTATMVSQQQPPDAAKTVPMGLEQKIAQQGLQLKNAVRELFRRGGDREKSE